MRDLLADRRPRTAAEALGLLRRAFPETALSARVLAVESYRVELAA